MKLTKILYYISLGFIALIAITLIVSIFPISGNYKVMTVLSGSMEPTIKTGSVVLSKPMQNYKIGDIITFRDPSRGTIPITHRIVEMEVVSGKPLYTTKGDANNGTDTKSVYKKDIVGKVILNVPFIGFIIDFIKKPLGFILIIIIPAIAIISDEIKKIWQEIKKAKKKKNVEKDIKKNE